MAEDDSLDSPHPGGRHRGPARLRGHVPVQQPRARGRGVRGGRHRHRAAHLAHLRPRPRLPRGPAPHPAAHLEADRHERAHRAVLEGLPRAHGALDRRGARGGRALLRDLARQPPLGGGPGAAGRRRRLPRRHRAQVGREGPRGRGARPHRRQRPGRRPRGRPVGRGPARGAAPARPARRLRGRDRQRGGLRPRRCAWATRARSSARASSPPPSAARARRTSAAIVAAGERDIVLTERLTGVPVAVIDTPSVRRLGTKAGPLARWMLRGRRTKHWMRTIYALRSLWALKRGLLRDSPERDYWQAGKSVAGIDRVEPAGEIVRRFAAAWRASRRPEPPQDLGGAYGSHLFAWASIFRTARLRALELRSYMVSKRAVFVVLASTAVLAGLVGCGGGGSDSPTGTPTPVPTVAPTPSTCADPRASPGDDLLPDPAPAVRHRGQGPGRARVGARRSTRGRR